MSLYVIPWKSKYKTANENAKSYAPVLYVEGVSSNQISLKLARWENNFLQWKCMRAHGVTSNFL